jgi:hypothetical protein
MAAVADLKKMIAAKRAELNDLEAKLKAVVDKLEHRKADKDKSAKQKDKLKHLIDAKDMQRSIELKLDRGIDAKALAEKIQKAIKDNPDLKKLEELKKFGKGKELDLKKLGEMHLELKGLEDLKKLENLGPEILDELKKQGIKIDAGKAKVLKDQPKIGMEKTRRADDIDARLEKLLREVEQLRREIRQSKDKQVK